MQISASIEAVSARMEAAGAMHSAVELETSATMKVVR